MTAPSNSPSRESVADEDRRQDLAKSAEYLAALAAVKATHDNPVDVEARQDLGKSAVYWAARANLQGSWPPDATPESSEK